MVLSAVLVQACGGLPFAEVLFPPTKTPPPSATPTITLTPTRTATPTKTPTFTPSPTIVRFPTEDPYLPTATAVIIPIPSVLGGRTHTPVALGDPLIFDPGGGFTSVAVSTNKIYWGVCKNNKTTIVAVVEDPEEVLSVVIFVRVKSAKKEDYTPWTTGDAMHDHGNGKFSYILRGSAIEGHDHYLDSWVFFQLVATGDKGQEVGRTQIYREAISLSPCM